MDWNTRRHNLDYDSAVALRYHGHRKAFLDGLARVSPALSVMSGSAAFAGVISGHPNLAAVSGLFIVAINALDLAFAWAERGRVHEGLFRDWAGIQAELAMLPDEDENLLRALEAKRARVDAASPNQMYALSVVCENEEKEVRRSGPLYRVGWWANALKNWFTLPGWQSRPCP